jgi:hypothetical protein
MWQKSFRQVISCMTESSDPPWCKLQKRNSESTHHCNSLKKYNGSALADSLREFKKTQPSWRAPWEKL